MGPQKVTVRYLERGHTFMRADSVHGCRGSKMKKCQEIHTFDDFVKLCQKASKKIKAVVMHPSDFYALEDGHRSRQSKNLTLPKLSELCEVEFHKGSRSMWCKESFDNDQTEVNFLKPKVSIETTPDTMQQPRGISTSKKQNIVKLVASLPAPKRKFWLDMPVNDGSKDLIESFQ